MEDWMIRESAFAEDMEQTVWPYLNARKKEMRLKTKDGKLLAVYHYFAENPEQVVVISHGFTETAYKYAELTYYYLIHGFDVYIVEHCGHGKSYRLLDGEPCKVYVDTYQRYVRDLLKVAALAKKENPELPLTLFGHSMGGGIAGVAAGRKPEWFDRVILSSPMIQPQTGGIPWGIAKALAHIACFFGRGKSWIFGHGPYKGLENFDTSASASRARFDYYQAYKNREATAQLSGATYGWIRAAAGIHRELMSKTIHRLHMPLLLVQAGSDQSVRNDAQDLFIELLQKDPDSDARMVQIPCSKHEIFNSPDEIYAGYLREIFRFCSLR